APSGTPVKPAPPPTVSEMAARTRPSVAVIQTDMGLGTGFVVGPNVVATNLHVVAGASVVTIRFMDGAHASTDWVVAIDPEHDLALLPLPSSPPVHAALGLGNDGGLRPGDPVVAVGNPEGLALTVSTGIIAAIREVNPRLSLLQVTSPISPGS